MIDHSYEALQIGKEIGETCRHWLDFDIYDYLPPELKDRYFNQCNLPEVIYRAIDDSWCVRCKPCDLDLAISCTHTFPKIAETIKKNHEDEIQRNYIDEI
jgi:ferredoxin